MIEGLWLDSEDSLGLGAWHGDPGAPGQADMLRVAVVRLPRISNFTDADALAAEPSVAVRYVTTPGEISDADLVILPGSRATVADLTWLGETGLAEAIAVRARDNRPVLGICSGFQMLGGEIHDDVESGAGRVGGLGVLPATVRFGPRKVLRRCQGEAFGEQVSGYEIHHGVIETAGGEPFPGGCTVGAVSGTSWHGLFESDGFRRAFLSRVAATAGRRFTPAGRSFQAVRERQLDALGDLIGQHMDTGALQRLIERGAPDGLPTVAPRLS
jgi:adenosylcobyric acid synthase